MISFACHKDIIPSDEKTLNGERSETVRVSIEEARTFFESKNGQVRSRTGGNSQKERKVLWEKAYNKSTTYGEAVAVPIELDDERYQVGDGKSLAYSDVNYLLIYKDSQKGMQDEWVQLRPDERFLYSDQRKYTGEIVVNSWMGETKKVFHYSEDGSVREWTVTPVKRNTKNGRTSNFI